MDNVNVVIHRGVSLLALKQMQNQFQPSGFAKVPKQILPKHFWRGHQETKVVVLRNRMVSVLSGVILHR